MFNQISAHKCFHWYNHFLEFNIISYRHPLYLNIMSLLLALMCEYFQYDDITVYGLHFVMHRSTEQ